jgi:hypothetical protein
VPLPHHQRRERRRRGAVEPGRPSSDPKDGPGGGFFCVNGKMRCVHPTEVMAQLKKEGDQIIWDKTREIMGPYL